MKFILFKISLLIGSIIVLYINVVYLTIDYHKMATATVLGFLIGYLICDIIYSIDKYIEKRKIDAIIEKQKRRINHYFKWQAEHPQMTIDDYREIFGDKEV